MKNNRKGGTTTVQSGVAEIKTEIAKEIAAEKPLAESKVGDGKMTISSGVFAALVLLLVGSLFYNVYAILTENRVQTKVIRQAVPDSIQKADSTPVVPKQENTDYGKKQKLTDSVTKSTINDAIKADQNKSGNPDSTGTDTTNNPQN